MEKQNNKIQATVRNLIEKLKTLNQDAIVCLNYNGDFYSISIDDIENDDERGYFNTQNDTEEESGDIVVIS